MHLDDPVERARRPPHVWSLSMRNVLLPVLLAVTPTITLAACSHAPEAAPPTANPTAAPAAPPLRVEAFTASEKGVDVTSSLILGERGAILVDAQFIDSDARRLVETIRASGRHLDAVYITHAHPDHYFGLAVVHAAFPDARVLAHPTVAAEMKARWQGKHDQWKGIYGADLTDTRVDAEPYAASTLDLEGRRIELLGPQQGDDAAVVTVYVPDARTLIASDTSYDGTHVWLADTSPAGWHGWLETLARLEALGATTVISGHHDATRDHDPGALAATARYIRDFEAVVAANRDADAVVKAMTAKYPSLKLPIVLQIAAGAAFGKH
jgi:glyoxylase-like metal-dependent hydrolase (beta-lactamase superfamily II)